MGYDVEKEYINVDKYSPFYFVNEISPQYQFSPFFLPIVSISNIGCPVHPDMFSDLSLKESDIIDTHYVHPTSSFRTVYYADNNVCYKLPVKRRITRSVRDLSNKALERSETASRLLKQYQHPIFKFLEEECHYNSDPNFNYIIRKMPESKVFPWFCVLKSNEFDVDFVLKTICGIIDVWMFFASNDVYFEMHTQNIMVDENIIYYRDLSDVRSISNTILRPSFFERLNDRSELLSIMFDRTVLKQNIELAIRHVPGLFQKRSEIKRFIREKIEEHKLEFPAYSLDFSVSSQKHVPYKESLTWWRRFH